MPRAAVSYSAIVTPYASRALNIRAERFGGGESTPLQKIFPQLVTKSSSGFCFSVEYTFFVYFNGRSTSFEPDFGRMVKQLS